MKKDKNGEKCHFVKFTIVLGINITDKPFLKRIPSLTSVCLSLTDM